MTSKLGTVTGVPRAGAEKQMEGKKMDREEILAKSQSAHEDERVQQVKAASFRWVYLAMVLSAAVFGFIRGEQGLPMMDLCATVCLSVSVAHLYQGIKLKNRFCILLGTVLLVMAVAATVRFFQGH